MIRLASLMLVVGVCVAVLAIGAYFFVFGPTSDYRLSRTDSAWSNFGSYVGGVLGPTFALLAFLAVLLTVWLQAKQIEGSRKQAHLEELQRVIATVAKTIDDALAQSAGPNTLVPAMAERTVFNVLSAAGTAALTTASDQMLTVKGSTIVQAAKDSLLLQSQSLLIEMQQLVWCLEQYEIEDGSPTVVDFYKRRYNPVICWLDAIDLVNSSERIQNYFKPKEFREFLVPGK
jgi:hypothetical protein